MLPTPAHWDKMFTSQKALAQFQVLLNHSTRVEDGLIRMADATLTARFVLGSETVERGCTAFLCAQLMGICLRFLLAVHPPRESKLRFLLKLRPPASLLCALFLWNKKCRQRPRRKWEIHVEIGKINSKLVKIQDVCF